MKRRPLRLLPLLAAALALATGSAQAPQTKPGYNVIIEVAYDEQGVPQDGKVFQSDDPTGDHQLEQIALNLAQQDKQQPHVKDGKPAKFKARRPFNFPVEGDQGPAANQNKPVLQRETTAVPVYPAALAEQGVSGGAIVALTIRADGSVTGVKTLRASNPEFAQAAETALAQWHFVPREGPGIPAEAVWHAAIAFTSGGQNVDLQWRLAPRPALGGFIIGRMPAQPAAPAAPAPAPAEEKK